MQKLIYLLELEHLSIQGNLIKKANEDMDTGINFANSYFSNLLKEQMMTSVIEESTRAILLVDVNKRLHYINETAYDIFGLKIGDSFLSDLYLTQRMITENEYKDEILTYRGGTYLVEKINYYLADEYIGYILVLQNEYELRETASNLSKQLKHTGFYAKYNFSDIVHKSVSMKKCIEMAKKLPLLIIQFWSGVKAEQEKNSLYRGFTTTQKGEIMRLWLLIVLRFQKRFLRASFLDMMPVLLLVHRSMAKLVFLSVQTMVLFSLMK